MAEAGFRAWHLLSNPMKRTIYPPFITIETVSYKSTGHSFEQLPDGAVYLGEIQSTVPGTELPTASFQANSSIMGAPIYQVEDRLFVLDQDAWWEYCLLPDSD